MPDGAVNVSGAICAVSTGVVMRGKWMTVEQRRSPQAQVTVQKIVHGNSPHYCDRLKPSTRREKKDRNNQMR